MRTRTRIATASMIAATALTGTAVAQAQTATVTANPAPAVTVTTTPSPSVKVVSADDSPRMTIGNSSASANDIKEWISVIAAIIALITPILGLVQQYMPQAAR